MVCRSCRGEACLSVGVAMKWAPDGRCAIKREDGAFRIFRGPQHGHVRPGQKIVFQLVDCRSHAVIAIDRGVENNEGAVLAVIRKFKDIADHA